MKFVQTFWTGNHNFDTEAQGFDMRAGWLSSEFHWMSWAYSCFQLKKLYGQVELVTDERGKELLIDRLKLPYTSVSLALEGTLNDIHPTLFSLAKMKTYSLQTEPFVHVDGDLFLFRQIHPQILSAPLISSNPEAGLFFNAQVIDEIVKNDFWIPDHLQNLQQEPQLYSSNAGIIGANRLDFIEEYCQVASEFAARNSDLIDRLEKGILNFLIEQISLFYLARSRNLHTAYVSPEPVTDPLYQDFIRFAEIPQVQMVHAVGGCKRSAFMLGHLVRRFRMDHPKDYYRILAICREGELKSGNAFYNLFETSYNQGEVHFKRLDIESSVVDDFAVRYARSLRCLSTILPDKNPVNRADLQGILADKGIPVQCRDVYQVEKTIEEVLRSQIDSNWVVAYQADTKAYHDTVEGFNSSLKVDLMQEVGISTSLVLIKAGWNWWMEGDEDMSKAMKENFENPSSEHLVAVVPDILSMRANISYLDELDAYVMDVLRDGKKSIIEILKEVSQAFEEEIDYETNLEFQSLIFDTLKRLLFSNTLSYA